MKITMNMTDCRWDEERFLDGQDAADYLRKMELDGLELMHCQGGDPSFFPREIICGMHLRNWNDWVDLWQENWEPLREEYGSLKQAEKVYGRLDRNSIIRPLERQLSMAASLGGSYGVFHVCDVKTTELYSYQFLHTDEQVVDAAAELINTLLDGKDYPFEFLMENLWWPGLTMTRPEITERLLAQIHFPRKGIMLDTGHLMHTNLNLTSQEEAAMYLTRQIKKHGALSSYIRGIHLNQSITGAYVRELLKNRERMPGEYEKRQEDCYLHVFQIDAHLPFTGAGVREVVETLQPEYLTFEFITSSREEQEEKLRLQWKALGGRAAWFDKKEGI